MAEPIPNTRVAIYGRVSTRDKGQEVENQLAQLREFAVRQGWTICCEYADRESGANRDRIEFQESSEMPSIAVLTCSCLVSRSLHPRRRP
jgi:DNA invertase Pin-like site-specific DNA recombinase